MIPWRFLTPRAIGFTFMTVRQHLADKLLRRPSRPIQTIPYVKAHAEQGNPASVLATLDRFAREVRWLMSVGPEKDKVLQEVAGMLPENPRVLELGAYCGYSSIFIADTLAGSTVTTVEINPDCVQATRANVDVAGLGNRITVVEGASGKMIPTLEGCFDLVFLDHWKDLYLEDLQAIEARGLIKPGSVVVADNVGPLFGAEPYLAYVRENGKYHSENRPATVEYTNMPDAVEISVLQSTS